MSTSEAFPSSVIIVGAGVFGLSTALAIAERHPSTKITVIDRLTPPVPDGSSVDTTRCIRTGNSATDPSFGLLVVEWNELTLPQIIQTRRMPVWLKQHRLRFNKIQILSAICISKA